MSEFKSRRDKLFELLKPNSVAIIYGGVSKIKSEDEFYPFSVNKNFFYLTGIEQENSTLVLIKTFGERKEFLFVDDYNEVKERWTGKRLPFDRASEISDITSVYSSEKLSNMLDMIIDASKAMYGKIENIYLDLSDEIKINTNHSTILLRAELEEKYPTVSFENVYDLIVSLRMIKSKAEVDNLIEAINITNTGINDLLLNMHVGMSEYELSNRFEYFGKNHGRRELSFETITAAGKDATIMHHPIRQQTSNIEDGQLVLFDLGYKYNGYSADISRTYPVNGKFNEKQRRIYEAVLNCNKAVIDMVKPGLTILDLQNFTLDFLKKECLRLRLLNEEDDIKKYYIHNVSHFLGLDTHDVGDRKLILKPGNVITVEPGLYFVEDEIGVRIEDNVLVTEEGHECLSKGIVKEIYDVEKLMASRKRDY